MEATLLPAGVTCAFLKLPMTDSTVAVSCVRHAPRCADAAYQGISCRTLWGIINDTAHTKSLTYISDNILCPLSHSSREICPQRLHKPVYKKYSIASAILDNLRIHSLVPAFWSLWVWVNGAPCRCRTRALKRAPSPGPPCAWSATRDHTGFA